MNISKIKHVAQDIAEAIYAAFQMDVEIVNSDAVRVAATGRAFPKIGRKMQYGTGSKMVMETNQYVFIDNTQLSKVCLSCPGLGKCSYLGGIITPIHYENEIIGTINMVAYDYDRLHTIKQNLEGIADFLEKMSDLLATKMSELELIEKESKMNSALRTLINTISNGVIAIDPGGDITQINEKAKEMLFFSNVRVEVQSIYELFEDFPTHEIKTGQELQNYELTYKRLHTKHRYLANIKSIIVNQRYEGAVISLQNYKDVQIMAYEMMNSNRDITFNDIIGESPKIKEIKSLIAHVADGNSTILITGESGTGKEMFARAIHQASSRASKPFISINCGAIPETLIESELFGYEKGAFTGAHAKGRVGKFELADQGTIFLDEVGTMPLYLQIKLLRVLQTREIDKIGGKETIPVDVRIVAATNSNLEKMVEEGEFREDLYYRLNVIPIKLPPLRDRSEDIIHLSHFFIARYSEMLGRNITYISHEAEQTLLSHQWPGNIRELENAIEFAINLAGHEETILSEKHLPSSIKNNTSRTNVTQHASNQDLQITQLAISIDEYEKNQILHLLNNIGSSTTAKKRIAKQLGMSLATLYRKIKHYGI
ncbi:sigma 54-interacting transcriptional regulator [Fredinandcohnia sp. FSL W7-1320]|uniref:sigma 54-interacting transcriptional regulator n=1 Tax=Fredinandcohnia sp. FSL W7-1320 TaxID=2954540 RepID=UPI0030FD950C